MSTDFPVQAGAEYPMLFRGRVALDETDERPDAYDQYLRQLERENGGRGATAAELANTPCAIAEAEHAEPLR